MTVTMANDSGYQYINPEILILPGDGTIRMNRDVRAKMNIIPGIKIRNESIVAAGALTAEDVEARIITADVPVKLIKDIGDGINRLNGHEALTNGMDIVKLLPLTPGTEVK